MLTKIAKKSSSLTLAIAMVMGTNTATYADTILRNNPQISITHSGAVGYNVYVKAADASDAAYVKIDNELIRYYSSYWRVNALGLAAGKYVMKVEAIFEDGSKVSAFAFSSDSIYGTGSGAYNEDGTLKEGAQVVYVIAETAKTVELDVITSSKDAKTIAVGIGQILTLRQKVMIKHPLQFDLLDKSQVVI